MQGDLDGTLVSCFVGESLSLASAFQVGQETPVRAPQGHQVAAFTLRGGIPGFVDTVGHAATVQLRIGDRRIPVPNLFNTFSPEAQAYLTPWEMFCFCLPAGDAVVLEVTDESRTISLDIRTGVPVIDDDWRATTGFRERFEILCDPADAVFTREFSTLPPLGMEADTGGMSLGLRPDTLSGLQPWTPAQGWAPAGKQWLGVPMNARVGWEGRVAALLTLRVPESFIHRDSEGEVAAISPASITTDQITTGQADLVVLWPVTGGAGTSTISFNAVGDLAVDYAETEKVPAQFTSPVAPVEFTLTATPVQR